MFDRIAGFFFGRDVFVSYSYDDSRYAEALAVALQQRKFTVFLGGWGASPGEKLSLPVVRAAERCKLLVVVATPMAIGSKAVQDEIDLFSKKRRTVVPIDVGGAIDDRRRWRGTDPVPEEPGAGPSPHVIDRIENAAKFARQEQRLRRFIVSIAFAAIALIGGSTWFMRDAKGRADAALAQKRKADAAEAQAQKRRKDAEVASEAAARKTEAAQRQLAVVDRQRAAADAESQRQSAIGGALRMANDSIQLLQREPTRLVRAALLATAATRYLHERDVRALAADTAIRSALMLLPKVGRRIPAIVSLTEALSRNGRFLVTQAEDHRIHVYDTDLGSSRMFDAGEKIKQLRVSADGETVAAVSDSDWVVRVWRVSDGKQIASFRASGTDVALSDDGRHVAIADRDLDQVTVHNSDGSGVPRSLRCQDNDHDIDAVEFSPSGKLLALIGKSMAVWEWERSYDPKFSPAGGNLVFNPADEDYVATSAMFEPLSIWKWREWAPDAKPLWSDVVAVAMTFAPDGHSLAYITNHDREPRLAILNVQSPQIVTLSDGELTGRGGASQIAVDDGIVAVAYQDHSVTEFSGTTPVGRVAHTEIVLELAIRGGETLSVSTDGILRWSRAPFLDDEYENIAIVPEKNGWPEDTTLSKDKRELRFDWPDGRQRAVLRQPEAIVNVTAQDDIATTTTKDGTVRVWSLRDSRVKGEFRSQMARPPNLDPTGRFVAMSTGSAIELWSTTGRQAMPVAVLHHDIGWRLTASLDATFSHSGRYLVTYGGGVARVWSGLDATPVEVARFDGFDDKATVEFSYDERYVLVHTLGHLRYYPWRQEELIAAACSRLVPLATKDDAAMVAETCVQKR